MKLFDRLHRLLGPNGHAADTKPSSAERRLDEEIAANRVEKERLRRLLEPTGFLVGDAIMGREVIVPWPKRDR
jgi:hypothetical protein